VANKIIPCDGKDGLGGRDPNTCSVAYLRSIGSRDRAPREIKFLESEMLAYRSHMYLYVGSRCKASEKDSSLSVIQHSARRCYAGGHWHKAKHVFTC